MRIRRGRRHLPPGVTFGTVETPESVCESGSGCGTVFWIVVAVPFVVVARSTSGMVSNVFWGLAGFWALLAVINYAYYITGHGPGGWRKGRPRDLPPNKPH